MSVPGSAINPSPVNEPEARRCCLRTADMSSRHDGSHSEPGILLVVCANFANIAFPISHPSPFLFQHEAIQGL
jgi:hypothetical protein